MSTTIRPELSRKNKYWIDKHRYYELKHFCRQYDYWKQAYKMADDLCMHTSKIENTPSSNQIADMTATYGIRKAYYSDLIELLERTAREADEDLCEYLLKAVTSGLSFTYLKTKMNIPCSRDTYYDRYRRFFWLLNEYRK